MEDELRLAAENILGELNKARQTVGKASLYLNWGSGRYTAAGATDFAPFFDIGGGFSDNRLLTEHIKGDRYIYSETKNAIEGIDYVARNDIGEKSSQNRERELLHEAAAREMVGAAAENIAVSRLPKRDSIVEMAKVINPAADIADAQFGFWDGTVAHRLVNTEDAVSHRSFAAKEMDREQYFLPEGKTEVVKEVFGREYDGAKEGAGYQPRRNLEQSDIALIGMALAKELHEQLIAGYPMYVR